MNKGLINGLEKQLNQKKPPNMKEDEWKFKQDKVRRLLHKAKIGALDFPKSDIKQIREKLNQLEKSNRPKNFSKAEWKTEKINLRNQIVEIENTRNKPAEKSSGTMRNSFWSVSQENFMRESLGTGWDHKKSSMYKEVKKDK